MSKKLEELLEDQEFRDEWSEVLSLFKTYGINEAVLEFIHRPRMYSGKDMDTINGRAAIELWKIDGALALWDFLQEMHIKQSVTTSPQEDYSGEI